MHDTSDEQNKTRAAGLSIEPARLFRHHRRRLITYSYYITGDLPLSEEIIQEAFLRLLEVTVRQTIDNPVGWLTVCVRNLSLSRLREVRRDKALSTPVAYAAVDRVSPEQQTFIQSILRRLEPDERSIILLRELEGWSIDEMAESLEISKDAVKMRLYRIRKKMQKLAGVIHEKP